MSVLVLLVWKEDGISLMSTVYSMVFVVELNILLICSDCRSFRSGYEFK
jgi:hypothetical protein